jgi:hypothetical protein
MSTVNIVKGSRIRAQWFQAKTNPPACLAGAMMKFGATSYDVSGVIRHFRGDHPTSPTVIQIFIDPDPGYDGPTTTPDGCTCGHPHVQIDPKHIVSVDDIPYGHVTDSGPIPSGTP